MAGESTNGGVNGAADHIRFIALSFDGTQSEASALRLITELRPEWKRDESKIDFTRFTDGITNTLLKATYREDGMSKEDLDREAILLRAYGHGTELLIDRQRETQNHELLMAYGLAPPLLARFKNGIMYRYIRGKVTLPADLREPSTYLAVARRLAQWHSTVPCLPSKAVEASGANGAASATNGSSSIDHVAPGKPPPNVWTVMQKWILALPRSTDAEKEKADILQTELMKLVEELSQRPGLGKDGLVFAHCDLLCGNVILEPKTGVTNGNSSKESVNFIDYEYATPSPAAFDLANHFAEWGGFDCDYEVLPTQFQRQEFIREYVRTYFTLLPGQSGPADERTEVDRLFEEVDVFRGLPGFYWGIWSLIQAVISEIDFDYASYAEVRLGEYWAWRDETSGARSKAGREMPLRERRWAQPE